MNFPLHRMPIRASVFRIADSKIEGGEGLPKDEDEYTDVPCRIEAVSASDVMSYSSEVGTISHTGYFPSAVVALRDFGLIDFNIGAKWRVVIDDVAYRVTGSGVNMAAEDVMQRVGLETENQERAPE